MDNRRRVIEFKAVAQHHITTMKMARAEAEAILMPRKRQNSGACPTFRMPKKLPGSWSNLMSYA